MAILPTPAISPSRSTSVDDVVLTAMGPIGCWSTEHIVLTHSGNSFRGYIDFPGICFTTPLPLYLSESLGQLHGYLIEPEAFAVRPKTV
jgi:hypothetical protein